MSHAKDLILEHFLGNNASKNIFFSRSRHPGYSWQRSDCFNLSQGSLPHFYPCFGAPIIVNPKWCGPCREMQTVAPSPPHHKITLRDQRDYRERWPLLTVETEANGDSKSTKKFLGWFAGLLSLYKRFYSCVGCSSRPSTKYFFPHRTLFRFLWSHRPGSRAGSPVS